MKCISPVFLVWFTQKSLSNGLVGASSPSFSIIDIRIGTPYLWPNQCSSGSSISLFIRTAIKSRKKNARGDLYRNSICSSPFQKSLVEPKRDGLVTHPLFRLGRPSLIHWAIQAYWKGGFFRAGRRKFRDRELSSFGGTPPAYTHLRKRLKIANLSHSPIIPLLTLRRLRLSQGSKEPYFGVPSPS